MCRIERFANLAQQVAIDDTDPLCAYNLGAVITKGSRIIATGACSTKTDPKNPKWRSPTLRTQICAEVKACFAAQRLLGACLKGCDLYVVRVSKASGQCRMARPCRHCQAYLREVGIRRVYYTDRDGEIAQLSLN